MTRQVVVTGLGMTTPVGGDVATSWASVLAGKPGIVRIPEPWADEQPAQIAGILAVDPSEVLERVEIRRTDRFEQVARLVAH